MSDLDTAIAISSRAHAVQIDTACPSRLQKWLLLISIFFTTKSFAIENTCDFLLASPKVKGILSSFRSELQTVPSWKNYRLSQNPVVLMELNKNQNCAYDLLKKVKVTLNERSSMSCNEIEASFEFQEGIADYIFYATTLNSKQLDSERLITFLLDQYQPSKMKESYYAFGGLQLLALSMLDTNFPELQQSLLNSKSAAESLFSKLQERVYLKQIR